MPHSDFVDIFCWIFHPIPEGTIIHALLFSWFPAGLAGLGVYFLIPRVQRSFEDSRERTRRKFEIAEIVARSSRMCGIYERRLNVVHEHMNSTHANNGDKSKPQEARKEEYRRGRDDASNELKGSLSIAKLYFKFSSQRVFDDYIEWDRRALERQEQKMADDERKEVNAEIYKERCDWEAKLIAAMREELA